MLHERSKNPACELVTQTDIKSPTGSSISERVLGLTRLLGYITHSHRRMHPSSQKQRRKSDVPNLLPASQQVKVQSLPCHHWREAWTPIDCTDRLNCGRFSGPVLRVTHSNQTVSRPPSPPRRKLLLQRSLTSIAPV